MSNKIDKMIEKTHKEKSISYKKLCGQSQKSQRSTGWKSGSNKSKAQATPPYSCRAAPWVKTQRSKNKAIRAHSTEKFSSNHHHSRSKEQQEECCHSQSKNKQPHQKSQGNGRESPREWRNEKRRRKWFGAYTKT